MAKLSVMISFVLPLIMLTATSLLVIRSVSPGDFSHQLIFVLIGFAFFILVSRVDYQLYLFSPWPYYVLANIVLILTLFFGDPVRGSNRWLTLFGVNLQASELVKPLLILFIGSYMATKLPRNLQQILKFMAIMLVPTFLIYIQPDLGSALLIVGIAAASLVAGGVAVRHLAILVLLAVLALPLGYFNLRPYQRERIISFIQPQGDPLGSGYNSLQATIAVGSGKIAGRGLGQGTQSHLKFLPERHTDFIFASTVEELGFIGGSILLGAYVWLGIILIQTAKHANNDIGSIICLTSLGLILMQVVVNIGMNMGMLPITGITLPLVSAGGSSYISLMIILGVCFSIAKHASYRKAHLEIH